MSSIICRLPWLRDLTQDREGGYQRRAQGSRTRRGAVVATVVAARRKAVAGEARGAIFFFFFFFFFLLPQKARQMPS